MDLAAVFDKHFYKRSLSITNKSKIGVKVFVCRRDEDEGLPKIRVEDGSQKMSGGLNVPQGGGEMTHESAFHVEYELSKTKYPVPIHVLYLNAASADGSVIQRRKCSIDKGIACRIIVSRGKDEDACVIGLRAGDLRGITITDDFFPSCDELGYSCMPVVPTRRVTHPTTRVDMNGATSSNTDDRSSTSSSAPPSNPGELSQIGPIVSPRSGSIDAQHHHHHPRLDSPASTLPEHGTILGGSAPPALPGTAPPAVEDADVDEEPLTTGESAATDLRDGRAQSSHAAGPGLGSRTSSAGDELAVLGTIIEKVSDAFKFSVLSAEPNVSINLTAKQVGKTFAATLSRSTSTPALSIPSTPSSETRPPSSLSNSNRPSGATSPHNPVREAHPGRPESTPVPSLRVVPPSRTLSWSSGLTSAADTPSTYHPHNGSFAHRTPRSASSTPSTSPMYHPEAVTPPPRHYRTQGALSPCRASLDADEDPMKGYTPTAAYMKTGGHRNVSKKLF